MNPVREALQENGWYIRVTRWSMGWQVGAYWPTFPAKLGASSGWFPSEDEAWADLLPRVEAVKALPEFPANAGR